MNRDYWQWDVSTGKFRHKKDVDRQKAREDLNVHPEEYAIGCAAATKITMEGGAGAPRVFGTTTDDHDWVPGDDGYIENVNWKKKDEAIMGENIIYMGGKRFWGHYPNTPAVQTFKFWFDKVKSWDGRAKLTKDRNHPSNGLK